MRQSQSYRRGRKGDATIDMDAYSTFRYATASRIYRRFHGSMTRYEAFQAAAVPSFFVWLFRRPVNFFKRRRMDRKIGKALKSNSKQDTDQ